MCTVRRCDSRSSGHAGGARSCHQRPRMSCYAPAGLRKLAGQQPRMPFFAFARSARHSAARNTSQVRMLAVCARHAAVQYTADMGGLHNADSASERRPGPCRTSLCTGKCAEPWSMCI